jgi:hypothetical protein
VIRGDDPGRSGSGRKRASAEVEKPVIGTYACGCIEDGDRARPPLPLTVAAVPDQDAMPNSGLCGSLGEPRLEALAGGGQVPASRSESRDGVQDVVAVDEDGVRH